MALNFALVHIPTVTVPEHKIVNWIFRSYDMYIHSISDDSVDPVGVYTSPLKREHSFQNICISGLMYKIKNGIWC